MNKLNTIFILGYPRSGTTWFANLFNSHPDVAYRHEVIGRCYNYFPRQLFHDLKHNNGLDDKDYEQAMDIILSPNVESDRAPFFHKNHLRIRSIRLHYLFWIAAKSLKPLGFMYKLLFYPDTRNLALVVKETRSTVNMDSMLTGLRADKVLVLFRHPCGALASSLRGIEPGKMSNSTEEMRRCWYQENIHKTYLKGLGISEDDIVALPEHRYLAILWAQQNEDYLEFSSTDYEKLFARRKAAAQAVLDDARQKLGHTSLVVNEELREGPEAESILKEADQCKADLIVMGTRGLGALKGFLVGSVSRKVIHYASCPVMVVH